MTKFQGSFAGNLTSFRQFESCGMHWWTIPKSPIFLIFMLQLMSNFSSQIKVRPHIFAVACYYHICTKISFWDVHAPKASKICCNTLSAMWRYDLVVLRTFSYVDKEDRNVWLGDQVVLSLMKAYKNCGLNVTTDNFFTSLALARKLLERNTTIVDTIKSRRREIPPLVISTTSGCFINLNAKAVLQ